MAQVQIHEIELNLSNACPARCYLCSRAHGRGGAMFMSHDVWKAVLAQLHDVEFSAVQTSGDGDCYAHPHFLGWLKQLRREFPKATIHNYSSFTLLTPGVAEVTLGERLIDEQWTRIDSLIEDVQARSTCVNPRTIFGNIDHWISRNKDAKLHIGYSSIWQYHRKCRVLLGKRPQYSPFTDAEVAALPDEFDAISKRFAGPNVRVYRIAQSLWGEREDIRTLPDPASECPKFAQGLLNRIVWICPNGDLQPCGYFDEQSPDTSYGNILNRPLAELWESVERKNQLLRIARRDIVGYPCSPRCCRLYRDEDV